MGRVTPSAMVKPSSAAMNEMRDDLQTKLGHSIVGHLARSDDLVDLASCC